jgi:hypothetical protein
MEALAGDTGLALPWVPAASPQPAWADEVAPDLLHATRVFSAPEVTVDLDLALTRRHGVDRLHCWARLAAGRISALTVTAAPELEFSWFAEQTLGYHVTRLATPTVEPNPHGRLRAVVAGFSPGGVRRLGAREWALGESGWLELSPPRGSRELADLADPRHVRLTPVEPSGIGDSVAQLAWGVRA